MPEPTKPADSPADRTPSASRLREAQALLQRGATRQSEQILTGLLDKHPDNADAHRLMALLASRSSRQALALRHMHEACRLAPNDGALHFQLACLLAHGDQLDEALVHFHRATALLPDHVEAWRLQGQILARLQRNSEALESLRRAHQLAPDAHKSLLALAELEFHSGWPADALPLWQTLLEHDPDDIHARLLTGETLNRLGFQDQAVALFREGVRRQSSVDALWLALGQAEEDNGERDAARRAYEQALALHPDWPFALACLLGMLRGQAPDTLLQQVRTMLDEDKLADADRALLGYALGKAHDARGEYDQAMARWQQANAARQRVAGTPDPDTLRQGVDRTITTFDATLLAQRGPCPQSDARLLFVVGMPRSGTTLTEQIIASHPQAFGCGELPDIRMLARQLLPDLQPEQAAALTRAGALDAARDRYLSAVTRHAPADAQLLVDKEPLNFLHLGLIALLFPQARVVWCRRDPRDVAISIYGENFALDETLATDLAGIGHYILEHERLMRHWQAVLPLPIMESRYEALVSAPEQQARKLIDFADLPWDAACLDFHRSAGAVQSPSRWQVRQPMHTRSVGRWRNYQDALAPLLDVIGQM